MRISKIKSAITRPIGFKANGISCGIKEGKAFDLALLYSVRPAVAAAVFTKNKVKAWPILIGKKHISDSYMQAVIVNSGNANCCNGRSNLLHTNEYIKALADELQISDKNVFPSSTGVIGVDFKDAKEKIKNKIKDLSGGLSKKNGAKAALAILTTDTVSKEFMVKFNLNGKEITLAVMAKGAGMICPKMATMLVYFTTDCNITDIMLRMSLFDVVSKTFNCMSIDNDMSTNDTVLIMANSLAGNKVIASKNKDYEVFKKALEVLAKRVVYALVADGEGVTKICQINIKGAKNDKQAEKAARVIASSMLFKTALCGADPNWGRVMAAIGASGVDFNPQKIEIAFSDTPIYRNETVISNNLKKVEKLLLRKDISLNVNLAVSKGKADFITSDLTKEYIEINSEYTT